MAHAMINERLLLNSDFINLCTIKWTDEMKNDKFHHYINTSAPVHSGFNCSKCT